jgi:hypothetical protein
MGKHYLTAILLAAGILGPLSQPAFAAAKPKPAAPVRTLTLDSSVQVKLRDILGLIPQKDATELLARLRAIEERLATIEALLRATPIPIPADPLGPK